MWERSMHAVKLLALTEGSLKSRLSLACKQILPLLGTPGEGPQQAVMREIGTYWERVKDPKIGSMEASIRSLNDDEQHALGALIIKLYVAALRERVLQKKVEGGEDPNDFF